MLLQEISKKVEDISHDIRAEIIFNELVQNTQLTEDNIIISNEGQFSRAYRYDVLGSEIVEDNFDNQEYLKISLSRDSMYDTLPEGVVHGSASGNKEKSVNEMIKDHKHLKRQEIEARKFFSPFENEIFNYRVKIENIERSFLYKLNGSKPVDFFYDFWGLSRNFPPILVSKLIQILPYAYKIVGDIDLCCKFLSEVINEKVNFKTSGFKEYNDSNEGINLGDNRLGVDLICGSSFIDYSLNVTIEIGPIVNNPYIEFINNGALKEFIDCFYEHFFPMEVELKTILLFDQEQEEFSFNKMPILGYTTRI